MKKNDATMQCPNCKRENSIHLLRCQQCKNWLISHHWGQQRRWWMAGFLSILIPGLGHVYNGKLKKGIILFLVWTVWMGAFQSLMITLMNRPYEVFHSRLIYGAFIISFSLHVTILISTIRLSVKTKKFQPRAYNKFLVYFLTIILIFPIGVRFWHLRRVNIFHFYKIPSTSMMDTIIPGDVIISNQKHYKENNPRRQNLIIFQFPNNKKMTYLKRVIGLPGDTLIVHNKAVWINGDKIEEPYAIHASTKSKKLNQPFGPVIIPKKSYFVMGDNRTWSIDSRLFGPVHQDWIIGKPQWIFWSWNLNIPLWKIVQKWKSIRLERLGNSVS